MKKFLSMLLVVVLTASICISGTMAYLQDDDSDVNVMTLGNVSIEQIEQERDDAGNLVPFTPNKPVYPAVYEGDSIPWADAGEYPVANNDAWKVVADNENVVDKFVTVKNTGKSDAFVRTIIAFEVGKDAVNDPYMHFVCNNNNAVSFEWATDNGEEIVIEVDGGYYMIGVFTYKDALTPGDTTIPSVKQIYLDKTATNEVCAAYGDTFEVLVVSQAVQAEGFDSAAQALDTAFGKITTDNHPWTDGVFVPDHFVSNLDELKAAFAEGGNVLLTSDIKFDKMTAIEPGKEVHLNLNGKKITVNEGTTSNTLFYVKDGAKLVIDGDGTIDLGSISTMAIFAPYGELVIENGTFVRDEVTTVTNKTTGLFMGAKTTASNVTINGGYFDAGYYDANAADVEDILAGNKTLNETADDEAKRGNSKDANPVRVAIKDNVSVLLNHSGYGSFKIYGGTFVGANPAWGDEGCMLPTTPNYLRPWSYYQGALLAGQEFNEKGIVLPAGYTITQGVTVDGVPTYTVSYSK